MGFKRLDIEPLEPDERVIELVQRIFYECEPVLVEVVTEYAIVPARLEYLLDKLDLNLDGETEARLIRLREHARDHEEREFAMQIRRELWKAIQAVERRRIQASLDAMEADKRRHSEPERPADIFAGAPILGRKIEDALAAIDDEPESSTEPGEPPRTATETPKPQGMEIKIAPPQGLRDVSEWVVTPTYEGPDRRARRSDRRGPFDRRGVDDGQFGDKRSREDRRAKRRRKTD